jgi:drug/metabolite transporter (DMT)-like permease
MKTTGAIWVFLGACSYGILTTFVKLAYKDGWDSAQVTGSQMLFGLLILWLLFVPVTLIFKGNYVQLKKSEIVRLMLLGSSTGLVGVFYYQAVQYLPASVAIIMLFQFTWMGVLWEAILEKKWPNKDKLIMLAVVLGGTFLASGFAEQNALNYDWRGWVFGLMAAFCYTVFIYFNGTVAKTGHPWKKSSFMLIGASSIVLLIYPPTFVFDGSLSEGLFGYAMILSVFGTVLPPVLYATGMPKIGIGMGSLISSAELPVAVVVSAILLHEKVSVYRWLGIVIIILALGYPYLKRIWTKKANKQSPTTN